MAKSNQLDQFIWREENTVAVLNALKGFEPLVSDARLKAEVEAVPRHIQRVLPKEGKRPSNIRSTYRKFAAKWPKLSMALQERILQDYEKGVDEFTDLRDLLEWLRANLTEEFGGTDKERQSLRPVCNSLKAFDNNMVLSLAFEASHQRVSNFFDSKQNGESGGGALTALIQAAEHLGRASVKREQQERCTQFHKVWQELSVKQKRGVANFFEEEVGETVTFKEMAAQFPAVIKDRKQELPLLPEMVSIWLKLDFDTIDQLVGIAQWQYGALGVDAHARSSNLAITLDFLAGASGYLGDPRAFQILRYSAGELSRAMVHQAAWLLVVAGHSRLSATNTGPLASFLTELDYQFEPWKEPRDCWGDMIKDTLGSRDERDELVGYLKGVALERQSEHASSSLPMITRIS